MVFLNFSLLSDEFLLPEDFPTASEEMFPLLRKRDATAEEVCTADKDKDPYLRNNKWYQSLFRNFDQKKKYTQTHPFSSQIHSEIEHSNPTLAKIPILDIGKFKQWKFRIQQYLQNEHYALCEVIEFSDSYESPQEVADTGSASEGSAKKKGRTIAVTTEDMQKRRDDVKARITLLLDLPDKHQLRFSKYKTAQELWAAILKTFEGKETLEQTFNRLQAIILEEDWEKISIQGTDVAGFDKSKMGHFARECRAPKSQDRGRRENYRQGSKEEEQALKALMVIDEVGWDWSYIANEEEDHALVADQEALIEFALMAKSSSDNDVFDNSLYSKACKKNTDSLNTKITELSEKLSDTKTTLYHYKLGYSVVPPPPSAQVYSPPKKDMSGLNYLNLQMIPSLTINNIDDKGYWDSGCSWHMTGNISYLSDYEPYNGGYVSFGQGGCKITSKGTIKTGKLKFENVYFVKDLKYNLLSVSQICDNQNSVLFTGSKCIVLGRNFKLKDDTNVLLRTPRQHNMNLIDLNNVVPHKDLTCLVAKASADESMLLHRRLGHLNFKIMNRLVRHNLVKGLPSKCFDNEHTCVACLKGKQHKASCNTMLVNTVSKPLHTLHMHLFGPTSVSNLNHTWYFLVVTDDFSRFTWTFFLKTNDETSGILRNFITEIENLKDLKVKIIRCDNGGEFRNKEMNDFCSRKMIKREFSNARTPQQNEVAERRNKTLIEAAITMLADAKLPITFWAEVVNTACYVQNMVLVNKSQNKTPYELFNECIVLGRNFKLKDDTNMLLRTPRQHNMYLIDLNNVVSYKDLTCLVAKASADKSMLWHMRLGHLNFKTMNRTLIEAARTMLADAKLPDTFWAEAINIACYVQNRVLVNKSQNKTSYELFNGRTPAIGFLKPFRCHVMILNTLDNLGKFDVKEDEDFLENKLIKKGAGLNWLFDIDSLTNSMNYVPVVVVGTTSTNFSVIQDVKKDMSSLRYIAFLNWFHEAHLESSTSNAQDACNVDAPESSGNSNPTATSTNPLADHMETLTMETPIPTVSSLIPTACLDDSLQLSSDTRLISKRVTSQDDTPSLKGYFVRYSLSSKAFSVFNKRTKKVEENMHVDFLENKLIEKADGLNWLFDIDTLTNSMNYVPVVVARTSSTNILVESEILTVSSTVPTVYLDISPKSSSGPRLIYKGVFSQKESPSLGNAWTLSNRVPKVPTVSKNFPIVTQKFPTGNTKLSTADLGNKGKAVKASACWIWRPKQNYTVEGTKDAASQDVKKDVSSLRYIALPNWFHEVHLESSTMETLIPTISSPVPTACLDDSLQLSSETRLISKRVTSQDDTPSLDNILTLSNRFEDILGVTTNTSDTNEVEADLSNMENNISASPTPTFRIHKDHPTSLIIGPMDTPI
uniref:Putative ribonuclease H-like domain-containing protein n=1 Tax=Tanacetum cinerariifolium TaxID=118510 RepID=A0A6L2KI00_TANCI|nr:putative ribonuclease H-like domain-containing protein [Tanacetum cinerariifolium]